MAVAAYARRDGIDDDEYVKQQGPLLNPSTSAGTLPASRRQPIKGPAPTF
jgi:hypothetical protein